MVRAFHWQYGDILLAIYFFVFTYYFVLSLKNKYTNVTRTLNEKRGNNSRARRISEVLSLAGPISGLMSYDGRVLRLAYEVGKTDGNYRSMASVMQCERKAGVLHAGYDGWRTRCHFCDL